MSPTKKKVKYIGNCVSLNSKYGKLTPGDVLEVDEDDYLHFIALPNFQDEENVIRMVARPRKSTFFRNISKKEE